MRRDAHYFPRVSMDPADVDYHEVKFFLASPNHRPMHNRSIDFVVIHITGGPAQDERSAINRFLRGEEDASAHYIVNRQGEIFQMVREKDVAYHAGGGWQNNRSIGIEHVNSWNTDQRLRPTQPQYAASARLVHDICRRHGIPMVHSASAPTAPGIKGHAEIYPATGHPTCPNPAWDWDRYMPLAMAARSGFGELIGDLARGR